MIFDPKCLVGHFTLLLQVHDDVVQAIYHTKDVHVLLELSLTTIEKSNQLVPFLPATDLVEARHIEMWKNHELIKNRKFDEVVVLDFFLEVGTS